jgi:hypothetical protein
LPVVIPHAYKLAFTEKRNINAKNRLKSSAVKNTPRNGGYVKHGMAYSKRTNLGSIVGRCRALIVVNKAQTLVNQRGYISLNLLAFQAGLFHPGKPPVRYYVMRFNPVKRKTDCIYPALIAQAVIFRITAILYFIKYGLYHTKN